MKAKGKKPAWRLQKGNRVEWFDGNKKGTGTIFKRCHIKGSYFFDDTFDVKLDSTDTIQNFTGDKIRSVK